MLLAAGWYKVYFYLVFNKLKKTVKCTECGGCLSASKLEIWGDTVDEKAGGFFWSEKYGCILVCDNCKFKFYLTPSGEVYKSGFMPCCPNCLAANEDIEITGIREFHFENGDDEWITYGKCKNCNAHLKQNISNVPKYLRTIDDDLQKKWVVDEDRKDD